MRQGAGMDDALDRLAQRDQGADEDCGDDREPGYPFAAQASQKESQPERDRGQCVAEIVNEVREQRHAERARVDERQRERGEREDSETPKTAPIPARERRIERSTSPCECTCS